MIQRKPIELKLKIYKECGDPKILFSHGMCKWCASKRDKKPKEFKPYSIPKMSKKRELEQAEYLPLRKQFLIDNPICQARLNGCVIKSYVHHRLGRTVKLFLDVTNFMALCRSCHSKVHTKLSADDAKALGLK